MKQLPRLLLFTSAFTILAAAVHAADISATGTGALNAGGSWVGGTAPGAGESRETNLARGLDNRPDLLIIGLLTDHLSSHSRRCKAKVT